MRNRIFGAIGVFWGGSILLRWFLAGEAAGSDAYQAGRDSAAVFGLLLLLIGAWYLIKKPSA